jgi:predicted RNase H-like HicB family nuclease
MNKYGFRILWSDEDKGYIATCPEFPGLSAFGETQEEALAEGLVAQRLFIEDMQERGEGLPSPLMASEFSGQTRLRLPKSLHRLAAELAATDGVSLNQFILEAISQKIGAEKGGQRLLAELRSLFEQNARQRRSDIASFVDLASIVWKEIGTQTKRVVRTTLEQVSTETTQYLGTDVKGH